MPKSKVKHSPRRMIRTLVKREESTSFPHLQYFNYAYNSVVREPHVASYGFIAHHKPSRATKSFGFKGAIAEPKIIISSSTSKGILESSTKALIDIESQLFKLTKEEAKEFRKSILSIKDIDKVLPIANIPIEMFDGEDEVLLTLRQFVNAILKILGILKSISERTAINESREDYQVFWNSLAENAKKTSKRTKVSSSVDDLLSDL